MKRRHIYEFIKTVVTLGSFRIKHHYKIQTGTNENPSIYAMGFRPSDPVTIHVIVAFAHYRFRPLICNSSKFNKSSLTNEICRLIVSPLFFMLNRN